MYMDSKNCKTSWHMCICTYPYKVL